MMLDELPLRQCKHFWDDHGDRISNYEKFKVLSVTGGVPRYLEEIDPSLSADENILRLAFESEGILFTEFEKIFHDLFIVKGLSTAAYLHVWLMVRLILIKSLNIYK